MCGIVGYTGNKQAQSILMNSLAKLEYRGYDSCGIALNNPGIRICKDTIRVAELANSSAGLFGTTGIGHTRWATHGRPCQANAHPHVDCNSKIAVVHNGIINNYRLLRYQLEKERHKFTSETDTEVIPHLVEKYYQGDVESGHGTRLESAVKRALRDIEGSYAIIVMVEGEPGLVFARKDSPLIIGIGDNEYFLASDVPAILDYTDRVIYLENGDMGSVAPGVLRISQDGSLIYREEQQIPWQAEQANKGGYEHFMLKEIHEQPRIVRNTISEYLSTMTLPFTFRNLNGNGRNVLILACGTSYHSALIAKNISERLIDISIDVEIASEFNYCQNLRSFPVAIGITQSGETADTIKAMRRSKESGSIIVAITNVFGSAASKIADYTIFTRAGPEISVAATKSFMSQLMAIYWLTFLSSNLEPKIQNEIVMGFRQLPDNLQQSLAAEDSVAENAMRLTNYEHLFYIGRGINYAIALEGALKLKEISYIHSEAWAAGELKHGPFALLSQNTPVIAIVAHDSSYEAMLNSIKEIKARGAPVFAIVEDGDENASYLADYIIPVPKTSELFSPFVNTVIVQLLAYYTAKNRHCPIDFPRNLAKSVTVE
jgi:glutamine---fructose-6-phosphate transaminase (isomerizing)